MRSPGLDGARSWYALVLLLFAYSLSYIDRQMLNLLVDPIKHSLSVSDTQFSLLQGTAFVVAYVAAAPLFGRLVDVTNRRNILIFAVCMWSICTALCGTANNYFELFLARFGVGVAESSVFPVTVSIIAGYFSKQRAARALSIVLIGPQLGGGFSLIASGLVVAFAATLRSQVPSFSSLETWQMAFVVVGLPGLIFGALLLTLREPPRRKVFVADAVERNMTLREVRSVLWARRQFYGRIYLSNGMLSAVLLSTVAWYPSFLIRAHHMPASDTGLKLGAVAVISGVIGTLMGPAASRALEARGCIDAPLRTSALSAVGMLVACVAIPLVPGVVGALCVAATIMFFAGMPIGIVASALQQATPNRMQGVVASLYTFAAQLIGYGIGPTAVALFTDRIFMDPTMVGYSMQIVMCIASLIVVWMLFSVLPHYREVLGAEVLPAADSSEVRGLQ